MYDSSYTARLFVGLLLLGQNCLNPVWLDGLLSPTQKAHTLQPIRLVALALAARQPNWVLTTLASPQKQNQLV